MQYPNHTKECFSKKMKTIILLNSFPSIIWYSSNQWKRDNSRTFSGISLFQTETKNRKNTVSISFYTMVIAVLNIFKILSCNKSKQDGFFQNKVLKTYLNIGILLWMLKTYTSLKSIVLEPVIPITRKSMLNSSLRTAACQNQFNHSFRFNKIRNEQHFILNQYCCHQSRPTAA